MVGLLLPLVRGKFRENVTAALERVKEASGQKVNEQQNSPSDLSDDDSAPENSMENFLEKPEITLEDHEERWIQNILTKKKPVKWDFFETDGPGGTKRFRHDIIAKYLIRKMGIIIFRGRPHVRVGGIYRPDSKQSPMIEHIISDIFPDSKMS